ncbi:putative other 1 protein kinase [Lyophyllum shimeji]|uniref:Other 1 protein kinase n=1 Tax=Lyophyllum shimeji TaxID=47721 RepID=A0A9P3URZ5_LYOSH|nr:putative other 1 protein kinase [Lyophyllum shimeji]
MMTAVAHAFTAHQQAYEKCGIIHRDISAANILITDDGGGILNDGDLAPSHQADGQHGGLPRHERTGTWAFMPCLLQGGRSNAHTIQDDMESFVHIVLYHSVRYLPHNKTNVLEAILEQIFDDVLVDRKGVRRGGGNKYALFRLRGEHCMFSGFQLVDHPPLNAWIEGAIESVGEWLEAVAPKRPKPTEEDLKTLQLITHQPLVDLFDRCLAQAGWPMDDKAVDRMRRRVFR